MQSVVCFFREGSSIKRHSTVFLSEDISHDHHAVNHFTLKAIDNLNLLATTIEKVYIFSDDAASQYKGKGNFADLGLLTGTELLIF